MISLAVAAVALSTTVVAQATNYNPTGYGCLDPQGFVNCVAQQEADLNECLTYTQTISECMKDTKCTQACIDRQMSGNIGCWVQSCWNMRNSCRYQQTAIEYIQHHGLEYSPSGGQVPFFPAPDNADGGCKCNLGYIYGNQTITDFRALCTQYGTASRESLAECGCCDASWRLDYIYNACPNGDISFLNIDYTIAQAQKKANSLASGDCTFLSSDSSTCSSNYNFEEMPQNNTWLDPFNLPAGFPGTSTILDTVATVTDFGLPSTTISLLPAFTSVITPVPWNDKNNNPDYDDQSLVGTPTSGTVAITAVAATGTAGSTGSGSGSATGSGSGGGNGAGSLTPGFVSLSAGIAAVMVFAAGLA